MLYARSVRAHDAPMRTTGQLRLHSCLHFFGLHCDQGSVVLRQYVMVIDACKAHKRTLAVDKRMHATVTMPALGTTRARYAT